MSTTDLPEEQPPLQPTEETLIADKETKDISNDVPENIEDDALKTLKYSLLGPSLLKAGQDKVDQTKVHMLHNCVSNPSLRQVRRFLKSYTTLLKAPNSSTAKKNETRFLLKRSNKSSLVRASSRRRILPVIYAMPTVSSPS
jgi:hypothetical protein